jgi:hypothetical protein
MKPAPSMDTTAVFVEYPSPLSTPSAEVIACDSALDVPAALAS